MLKADLHRYFDFQPGTRLLSANRLVLSHLRLAGAISAIRLMKRAYDGKGPKRSPIRVTAWRQNRYLVTDGNATSMVAIAAGWTEIPCIIDATPSQKAEP